MTGMCRGKTRVLLPGEDKGQQTMEHCSPLSTPRLDRQDSLSLGNTRIMQARTGGERNKNRPTFFHSKMGKISGHAGDVRSLDVSHATGV